MSIYSVDEFIARTLGVWCECCQKVTTPYESEDGDFPCCPGCWHRHDFWTPENLEKHADLVERYRRGE